MAQRRRHMAEFKAGVVKDVMREVDTLSAVAARRGVHPSQVRERERLARIEADSPLGISRQCRLLGVARRSYYRPAPRMSAADLDLMHRIDEKHMAHPFYGSRQMKRALALDGVDVGRRKVRRLMRIMGAVAVAPKPMTSVKAPTHKVFPYRPRGLAVTEANHVWCADITYVPMRGGFMYLVAVMDWATRFVLAWRLSNSMDAGFCLDALTEARRGGVDGWARALAGQSVHRASVAVSQVRGGASARVGGRRRCAPGHRRMDRLPQRHASALRLAGCHAEDGLRRRLGSLAKGRVKLDLTRRFGPGTMPRDSAFQPRESALISAPQLCHRPRPPLFLAEGQRALHQLGDSVTRLISETNRVLSEVISAADLPEAKVHRAIGRFEMILDEMLDSYSELRELYPYPVHKRGHELLLAVYRHTLLQLQGWLLDVVEAIADPVAAGVFLGGLFFGDD